MHDSEGKLEIENTNISRESYDIFATDNPVWGVCKMSVF